MTGLGAAIGVSADREPGPDSPSAQTPRRPLQPPLS